MTEQPSSAEALKIAQRWGYPGMKLGSEVRRGLFAAKRDERAALLARLQEPDEELIVEAQRAHCNPGRPPNNPCTFPDCGHCAPESREAMRAAIARIEEILTP